MLKPLRWKMILFSKTVQKNSKHNYFMLFLKFIHFILKKIIPNMRSAHFFKYVFFFLPVFLYGLLFSWNELYAINRLLEGHRASYGTPKYIDGSVIGGVCKKVTIPSWNDIFIGTKSIYEWNRLLHHLGLLSILALIAPIGLLYWKVLEELEMISQMILLLMDQEIYLLQEIFFELVIFLVNHSMHRVRFIRISIYQNFPVMVNSYGHSSLEEPIQTKD